MATQRDQVDEIMTEIPGLDAHEQASKALSFRLRRIAGHLETELRRELAAFGIELWEMELLGTLKRAGPPHRLSAGALQERMRLTSGGVTKRVTGLERRGWVRRDIDRDDRRQILVSLTEDGLTRAHAVFSAKTQTETNRLSALSLAAQEELNDQLRTLLVSWEGPGRQE
ncbi:MarR family winged helix-turn-helix transcriptional regulator [Sciscionella marina]|uniref:MarR family winged helix-turn-helix transcriptional regulator n=1 Tax=Sciscionella marina TaxID=508770 RepID=UPI00037F7D6E|nr:MarR family transcriptional regulator [Sciscionella marina]